MLTQTVSERLGQGRSAKEIAAVIWTTSLAMAALGLLAGVILVAISPLVVESVFHLQGELGEETLRSLYWLAVSVPLLTLTSGLKGLLESLDRFAAVNGLRVAMGVFNYLSPFLIFPWSQGLDAVVAILVFGRLIFFLCHIFLSLQAYPPLLVYREIHFSVLRPLFSHGGWITVSNVVGPIMVYFDRFILSSFVTMTLVAFYTTPYEVLTKLWIIPLAVSAAAFPLMAAATDKPAELTAVYSRSLRYTLLVTWPAVTVIFLLAPWGLLHWLGPEFATHSGAIARILVIGIFVNCLAMMPAALLQATRRAKWLGFTHLAELPFYLAAVVGAAKFFGVEGVALVWTLRAAADAVILFYLARQAGARILLTPLLTAGEKDFLHRLW
ncbi:MAG: hypothetical protein C5B49_09270, partial [Bdellovibrio sp.]